MEDLPQKEIIDGFLQKYKYYFLVILVGLVFIGGGFLLTKRSLPFSSTKVEVLENSSDESVDKIITVEVSGAVITPGVYKMKNGSRIDDLLIIAGGFSGVADRVWSDKYLNRASKLTDGQKVYIPSVNQQSEVLSAKNGGVDQSVSSGFSSDSDKLININTSSLSELDTLPGIGPTYAQKMIEHRPYSKTEELVSSGAITQTLYEKIKNNITIY